MISPEKPPALLWTTYPRNSTPKVTALVEKTPVTQSGVAEAARQARELIENEDFVAGFKRLAIARKWAESGKDELEPSDLVSLGNALESTGHVFYNYCVDIEGHVLPGWRAIGLEGLGAHRFQEASDIFAHALTLDPSNSQAQDGLARMRFELAPAP